MQQKPFRSTAQQLADDRHDHAKRCKRSPDECGACQVNIRFFASQPLPVLDEMLSDVRANHIPAGAMSRMFSFASVAVSNFVSRTLHNCKGPKLEPAGRAGRDVKCNGELFKAYVAAGGTL